MMSQIVIDRQSQNSSEDAACNSHFEAFEKTLSALIKICPVEAIKCSSKQSRLVFLGHISTDPSVN
jgi:hypothetical protein